MRLDERGQAIDINRATLGKVLGDVVLNDLNGIGHMKPPVRRAGAPDMSHSRQCSVKFLPRKHVISSGIHEITRELSNSIRSGCIFDEVAVAPAGPCCNRGRRDNNCGCRTGNMCAHPASKELAFPADAVSMTRLRMPELTEYRAVPLSLDLEAIFQILDGTVQRCYE
jgi:hypothetical protein